MEVKTKNTLEIQGITFLRFISISLVLISHNPFFNFKIGVIGVDLFFLISGFLITKQIEDLISSSSTKEAMKKFYFRRARRILPSLIVTLTTTLIIFHTFASPTLYNLAKNSSLPALGFFANFYQISQNSQYFNFAKLDPLASYWSLSAEEQIYLFLPLLLLIFMFLKVNRKFLPAILIITSITYIIIATGPDKYYNPLSRLLPFALGALLFYQPKIFNKIKINRPAFITLLLVYLVIFRNTNINNYPSLNILIPLVLTLLFLGSNLTKKYKDNAPIKINNVIGRSSYNIYLVYLPTLLLIESKGNNQKVSFILSLAITLVLGYLLYRLDLIIRKNIITPKLLSKLLAILLAIFALTYTLLGIQKISPQSIVEINNLEDKLKLAVTQGYNTQPQEKYIKQIDAPSIFPPFKKLDGTLEPCTGLKICEKNIESAQGTLFLLADSTGEPISPILDQLAKKNKLNLIWFNLTGCDPSGIPLDDWNITDGYTTKKCQDFYATLPTALEKYSKFGKFSIVYEQASSPLRTFNRATPTKELKDQYYRKNIALLKKYTNHITLISEVPFTKNSALDCLSKTSKTVNCVFTPSDPLNNYLAQNNPIIAKAEKLNYINLRDYLCININNQVKCPVVVENMITYRDILHISPTYLNSLSNVILPQFDLA